VELARSIKADADEEAVAFEKTRPLPVQQGGVRLQGIGYRLALAAVATLEGNCLAEEGKPSERRLAALPGKGGYRPRLPHMLCNERGQYGTGHKALGLASVGVAKAIAIEAVTASQVAAC
jgi:hypothetical protein